MLNYVLYPRRFLLEKIVIRKLGLDFLGRKKNLSYRYIFVFFIISSRSSRSKCYLPFFCFYRYFKKINRFELFLVRRDLFINSPECLMYYTHNYSIYYYKFCGVTDKKIFIYVFICNNLNIIWFHSDTKKQILIN